jgi:VIT1/CCC1 family predicted Fe2+/Mn2+ transporter
MIHPISSQRRLNHNILVSLNNFRIGHLGSGLTNQSQKSTVAARASAIPKAAGEYVSVFSQADAEAADRRREDRELAAYPWHEEAELADFYNKRGLNPALARQVAKSLTHANALEVRMRDELGVKETSKANPLQAALASALSFLTGGAPPLAAAALFAGGHV